VLMGAARLKEIATKLLNAGKPADTPVAAIMWGTTKRQRTVTTTLRGAARREGETKEVEAPCVIVVGRVVSLAPKLRWLAERGPTALGAASRSPASRQGSKTRRSRRPRT
jgi:siroheme synthase